jgi:FAD/FMN-containing dehydrogenase/Fe-S oxidoreductase
VTLPNRAFAALQRALADRLAGELRTDRLSRVLYATDASIYEIVPDGVVLPKSVADVVTTVQLCAQHGLPLTPRGAGTGLTGGAVNRGLQLDCSRYLNRILHVDPNARTATAEPGVVLDELNAAVKSHGLQFAPDVATSSRATIGGMIGNNSCGAHSVLYGRTCDHVLSVEVVLGDGTLCTFGSLAEPASPTTSARITDCDRVLADVAHDCADEIATRFPKLLRCNGGYALDRLRTTDGRVNTETIICGSEGTLGVVVGAVLKLTPLPKCKGLLLVQFDDVLAALEAVCPMLEHRPAAVELIDDLILSATKDNPVMARKRGFLSGEPRALLVCELFDDEPSTLTVRLSALENDLRRRTAGTAYRVLTEPAQQADVWDVRKSGLGLLMSRPGDRQPYAFIEDTTVEPARLPTYIRRLDQLLAEEGVTEIGYYAHASVGCLHVRPVLNLKHADDIARMRRIAERVCDLVLEFGGAMNGEHGDGLACSLWLEKLYGRRIVAAFKQIKAVFDPPGILNPGKIVDPLPMHTNLRYGAGFAQQQPATTLDFGPYGGLAGLANMCTGVGVCRQRLVGTMCPSYLATGDETHTTRARANALRVALSNRGLLSGLSDPALDEVMDLCLSCKACKTECPTGVDMARLKAEWLAHRNTRRGVPRRARLIAASIAGASWGCRAAPLTNWLMQARPTRALLELLFGLDHRGPPPRFARQTFRQWFQHRQRQPATAPASKDRPQIVYFVDTWTNFYHPEVGRAAVRVLEGLGYEVLVPETHCCGRPLVSKGLLTEARRLAEANVAILAPCAERGIPIVGTEPSCVSMMLDEWPQLLRTPAARCVAQRALMIETFLATALQKCTRGAALPRAMLYHGHCHQKALTGTADALAVLAAITGGHATEISSGCCGMAGVFGHEVEHYDVARAIGEQRLFPAIRARGNADIVVSGFSCREHIAHHTSVQARHVVEHVAELFFSTVAKPARRNRGSWAIKVGRFQMRRATDGQNPSPPEGPGGTGAAPLCPTLPPVPPPNVVGLHELPPGDDAGRPATDSLTHPPLPPSGVSPLPPAVPAGRGRPDCPAAARVWAGRDRAAGGAAVSTASQCPGDSPGVGSAGRSDLPAQRDQLATAINRGSATDGTSGAAHAAGPAGPTSGPALGGTGLRSEDGSHASQKALMAPVISRCISRTRSR